MQNISDGNSGGSCCVSYVAGQAARWSRRPGGSRRWTYHSVGHGQTDGRTDGRTDRRREKPERRTLAVDRSPTAIQHYNPTRGTTGLKCMSHLAASASTAAPPVESLAAADGSCDAWDAGVLAFPTSRSCITTVSIPFVIFYLLFLISLKNFACPAACCEEIFFFCLVVLVFPLPQHCEARSLRLRTEKRTKRTRRGKGKKGKREKEKKGKR